MIETKFADMNASQFEMTKHELGGRAIEIIDAMRDHNVEVGVLTNAALVLVSGMMYMRDDQTGEVFHVRRNLHATVDAICDTMTDRVGDPE